MKHHPPRYGSSANERDSTPVPHKVLADVLVAEHGFGLDATGTCKPSDLGDKSWSKVQEYMIRFVEIALTRSVVPCSCPPSLSPYVLRKIRREVYGEPIAICGRYDDRWILPEGT